MNAGANELNTKNIATDPVQALNCLCSIVRGLDHIADHPELKTKLASVHNPFTYMRNTLAVNLEFWREDLLARVEKSDPDFYVFAMIETEKLYFARRLRESFLYTASQLRDLQIPNTSHYAPLLESLVEAVMQYASDNKAQLEKVLSHYSKDDIRAIWSPEMRPILASQAAA